MTLGAGGQAYVQFTGINSWTVSDGENQSGSLEDFMFRRYSPVQGRWISPDPAGLGAVDPSNPQSWNRYAYVLNNPAVLIDPLGLYWLEACVQVNGGAPECSWTWEDDGGGGGPAQNPGGGPSGGGGGGSGAANNTTNCVNPNAAQRAVINTLSYVANWTNTTIGIGIGASYGLGFGQGFGFAGTGSAQLQVSPGGGASLVYTWGGSGLTQDWLTPSSFGASFILGPQISISSVPPSPGPGADVAVSGVIPLRGAVGPGASLDLNGSSDGVTGTLTGGVGAGIASGSAVVTQTAVVPLCTGR